MNSVASMMSLANFAAVGIGAALGAWARWLLALALNHRIDWLPLGTLLANLGGGFVIGVLVAYFEHYPGLAPHWRLFAITGFLGALTTFSTFSAESMVLLQRGDYGMALAHSGLHLIGSILCCVAGYAAFRALA